jgi:hypothetical protein
MYVSRRPDNSIYGMWTVRQFEGQEELPDDHPDVIAGPQPDNRAELTRLSQVDSAIGNDSTVASLKAMTNAEFDTWWAANVTNAAQAINVLKRVTRVVIRRLL